MANVCQVIPTEGAFAQGVIGFLDCQARNLGAGGYASLSAASSTTSLLLSSLLTLFIAFFGLRLLLGYSTGMREGVVAVVKVGAVLTLAAAWPAYQTLIYDVVLSGPAELASQIGGSAGIPGATGGLVSRLDGVDGAFRQLAILDVGTPPPVADVYGALQRYPPPLFGGFDTFATGTARTLFVASAIGAFAFLRLGAGILLALGPLFIAFLLFDATRGLLEGWIRALFATLLGSIVTSLALGVELALVEPWLADLLARRGANIAIPGVPGQLLAITLVFAVVIAGLIRLSTRLAFSLRFPMSIPWPASGRAASSFDRQSSFLERSQSSELETRTRASTVASAIAAAQRRESVETQLTSGARMAVSRTQVVSSPSVMETGAFVPLGSTFRRTMPRVSAKAGARDKSS